jgi:hypothetical protein
MISIIENLVPFKNDNDKTKKPYHKLKNNPGYAGNKLHVQVNNDSLDKHDMTKNQIKPIKTKPQETKV